MSVLRRWHLCQCLVRHFWQRWQNEYLSSINGYNKWKHPSRNVAPGDVVVLQESGIAPTKWPLGRVLETHPGQDNLVRVMTVKVYTQDRSARSRFCYLWIDTVALVYSTIRHTLTHCLCSCSLRPCRSWPAVYVGA